MIETAELMLLGAFIYAALFRFLAGSWPWQL
jgi:hypothetical protein